MNIDIPTTRDQLQKFTDSQNPNEVLRVSVTKTRKNWFSCEKSYYLEVVDKKSMGIWQRFLSLFGASDFNLKNVVQILKKVDDNKKTLAINLLNKIVSRINMREGSEQQVKSRNKIQKLTAVICPNSWVQPPKYSHIPINNLNIPGNVPAVDAPKEPKVPSIPQTHIPAAGANQDLIAHILQLQTRYSPAQIRSMLKEDNWSDSQIDTAIQEIAKRQQPTTTTPTEPVRDTSMPTEPPKRPIDSNAPRGVYAQQGGNSEAFRVWEKEIRNFIINTRSEHATASQQEQLRALLTKGKDFINCALADTNGKTALHIVAARGKPIEFISVFASCGASFNLLDKEHNTPLIWALVNAKNSMAIEVIKYDPIPDMHDQSIIHRNSPIHIAVAKGYTDVDAQNNKLTVPNIDIVKALLAKGIDVNVRNVQGNTPLHLACARRNRDMIQTLLQNGARLDIKNTAGKTALDMLNNDYNEAKATLDESVGVYLLEEKSFHANLEACRKLMSNK